MQKCINYGANCVSCPQGCVDDRCCTGNCAACVNIECNNHPMKGVKPEDVCIFPEWMKADGMCPCDICSNYNRPPLKCDECFYKRCPCLDLSLKIFVYYCWYKEEENETMVS